MISTLTPDPSPSKGEGGDGGVEALIDLEISLARAFSWSLAAIDETDIDSLLAFVYRVGAPKALPVMMYCDQVSGW